MLLNSNLHNFQNIFDYAKNLLELNGRDYYMLMMNKINETKLRNFPEIECFVIISCPFSSFHDYNEYNLYLVSVLELFLSFNMEKWGETDFVDFYNFEF